MRYITLLFVLCISSDHGHALDLSTLLAQGPVLTVTQGPGGSFQSTTAMVLVHAPVDSVWGTILDIENYVKFMPKVVTSSVLSRSADGKEITARFEIEVPLVNVRYTLKFSPVAEKKTIDVRRIAGDLKDSHWHWKLLERGKGTLVIYTGSTKNFSPLIQKFEDDQQTVTVGVNISTVMATTRAVKIRAEHTWTASGKR